jgi:hypothetical protein
MASDIDYVTTRHVELRREKKVPEQEMVVAKTMTDYWTTRYNEIAASIVAMEAMQEKGYQDHYFKENVGLTAKYATQKAGLKTKQEALLGLFEKDNGTGEMAVLLKKTASKEEEVDTGVAYSTKFVAEDALDGTDLDTLVANRDLILNVAQKLKTKIVAGMKETVAPKIKEIKSDRKKFIKQLEKRLKYGKKLAETTQAK